ncbi:hypothetical protein NEOLEDRAFT_1135377 [Neolentinus lepideus HHB14362 ss-1]|uniref:Oxidase ustYa n=1 Tax=Neolentinus lepideus HHB14362 ss-1 TaxID=1314782 RepID=A0A165RSR4_9AGAM|nr:hypothetical protein NEOLEDRAFT_1135377 [Neolentinus lepideus HHB14362 ss-1]
MPVRQSHGWSFRGPQLAFLVAAFTITFLNVGFTWYNVRVLSKLVPPNREYSYIGHDHPDQLPLYLPEVGLELTNGRPHFDLYDDAQWGTLFPSDGFTPLGPHKNTTFLVSMVHQMHCLDIMRVAFVRNRTGAAEHFQHCLRYLQQVIRCYADTTLEEDHPGYLDGKWEHGGSGVGSIHRCRDWTKVRKYLLENPAPTIDWPHPEDTHA